MVWITLRRPRRDRHERLQYLATLATNHRFPGASHSAPSLPKELNPSFWRIINKSIVIGRGRQDYERAKALLEQWAHFQLSWAFVHSDTRIEASHAYRNFSRVFLMWMGNPIRIEYVDEKKTDSGGKCFRFGNTTLRGHVLAGEERFGIELNGKNDEVTYEIYSFSRPAHVLGVLGYPLVLYLQSRFVQESLVSMQQQLTEKDIQL